MPVMMKKTNQANMLSRSTWCGVIWVSWSEMSPPSDDSISLQLKFNEDEATDVASK